MRTGLLFLLLVTGHFAIGQYNMLQKKVKRIDSLMDRYYSNSERARQEVDSLHDLLNTKYTGKEYKELKIDVMLQKSILYSQNGDHHNALDIALRALDEAEMYQFPERTFHSCWIIALMYENGEQFSSCRRYLNKAYDTYKQYNLDSLYSVYCIRMSSYYRWLKKNDSATYFAYRGLDSACKYGNKREIRDAYLLLGDLLSKAQYREAVTYRLLAAQKMMEVEDLSSAAGQFTCAAAILLQHDLLDEAHNYSDSAFSILNATKAYVFPFCYKVRSQLFEKKGNTDSAYVYFKMYHTAHAEEMAKMENSEIKRISEQYQNDKKEAIIKNKNQQLIYIVSFASIIAFVSALLVRSNRKINAQNKIINRQLLELSKTLEQKQVLLSELQHRVKNNLQHVISILEIQKESVDFNSIDELIRGNQNRIHSMALLHKKLSVSDDVNEVDLEKYIRELSELVKDSYRDYKKDVQLSVRCDVAHIGIEKALPIGLIIVELVSNSMKHAFKKKNTGSIKIEITTDVSTRKNKLHYADNGIGTDFSKKSEKGLGIEIIKGLIDQLYGTVDTTTDHGGFELTLYFN